MKEHFVHFVVDGSFVTDLARSWFWEENRDYSVCEELLCECLLNDSVSDAERKMFAKDIIEGKKRLCGTSDKGLTLEDDGENIRLIQDKIADLQEKLKYKVFESSIRGNLL